MDAFSPTPPAWTETATHVVNFACPRCGASSREASQVWLNRRSPVYGADLERKWQEFYQCSCECAWWAWSTDRPPTSQGETPSTPHPDSPDFDP
ncbi:MAG: hypothetical protein EAZ61_06025 [Oscillatoriales cyanobacterium]|nr:MAG: hypothetical protein EAZ61_06025 [Oscillatoriales cyanobacterium]